MGGMIMEGHRILIFYTLCFQKNFGEKRTIKKEGGDHEENN
jgi:hypothetical protein